MIQILLHLTLWQQCLLGGVLLLLLYQLYFLFRYMWLRVEQREEKEPMTPVIPTLTGERHFVQLDLFAPTTTGVSVVVAARNEAHNLRPFLQSLLEQNYPLFEVIVVNDSSEDETQAVLDEYARKYRQLRITFVPVQARVLSSKKLALTLAVKAAKYDHLLFTDADCRPESKYWIRDMMRGFEDNEDIEIVLGYGAYFTTQGHIGRLTQYETLTTGLQYMGFARAGHPYMGVGRNLAYKKDLFMRHNGFAGFVGEKAGDDDLFVNHTATRTNTAVVSTPESITWSIPKANFQAWYYQRRRHLSVSSLYTGKTKFLLTVEPVTRGLFYLLLIVLCLTQSWLLMAAAVGAYLFRLFTLYIVLAHGAKKLGGSRVAIPSIMWFDVTMPLLTLWLMGQKSKRNQYW